MYVANYILQYFDIIFLLKCARCVLDRLVYSAFAQKACTFRNVQSIWYFSVSCSTVALKCIVPSIPSTCVSHHLSTLRSAALEAETVSILTMLPICSHLEKSQLFPMGGSSDDCGLLVNRNS